MTYEDLNYHMVVAMKAFVSQFKIQWI